MPINIRQISSDSQFKRGRDGGIHVFHVVSFGSACYVKKQKKKRGLLKFMLLQQNEMDRDGESFSVLEFIYGKERRGVAGNSTGQSSGSVLCSDPARLQLRGPCTGVHFGQARIPILSRRGRNSRPPFCHGGRRTRPSSRGRIHIYRRIGVGFVFAPPSPALGFYFWREPSGRRCHAVDKASGHSTLSNRTLT